MPSSSHPLDRIWGVSKTGPKTLRAFLPRSKEQRDEDIWEEADVDLRVVQTVASGLLEGRIGILPTETVYGLVGSSQSDSAVQRIYEVKGRGHDKPLPIWIRKFSDLAGLGVDVNPQAEILARNFWPGPLTLILPFLDPARCRWKVAPELIKRWIQKKSVAIRIPDHPMAQLVLAKLEFPLVGTSANLSGQEPATSASGLDETLRKHVDWVVDGGPSVFQRESSIVICDKGWRILREGALRGILIERALAQASGRGRDL